jgi:co-chaperonin GroES (HSP10)
MKIQPISNMVQLRIAEATAGVLDTSSRASAVEFGEVIAVGPEVKGVVKGDKVFFKAWACDIINHEDKKYYFISETTNGILAIVK